MHVEKFTASAVSQMFYHVERMRDGHYSNESIDPSRTAENFSVHRYQGKDALEDYKARIEPLKEATEKARGKKLRKDAPCAVGVIVTLPDEYKGESRERQREFFQTAYNGLHSVFGNAIWGEVHMDEKSPHLHFGCIPEKDGVLNAKAIVNRSFLQHFHDDMDKYLREHLSWYHGGLVAEEKADRMKASEHMAMKDYKAVKEETDKLKAEKAVARAEVVKAENQIHQMAQTYREKEASYSAALQQAEEKGAIAADLLSRQMSGGRLTRAEKKTIKKDLWGYGLRRTEVETQLRYEDGRLQHGMQELADGWETLRKEEARLDNRRTELNQQRDTQQAKEKELEEREKAVARRESGIDRVFQMCKNLVRRLFLKDREVYNSPEVKEIERHFGRKIVLDTEKMGPQTREKGRETHGLGRG